MPDSDAGMMRPPDSADRMKPSEVKMYALETSTLAVTAVSLTRVV
jgi:hypothetical protein